MVQNKLPPMQDYTHKMMLLEAVRCYASGNYPALRWLEKQMFEFVARIKELEKRG